MPILVTLGLLLLAAALWWGWRHWRRRRRAALAARPLPEAWRAVLDGRVPLYRRLPPAERQALEGLVNVFLDDKDFVGCGGFEVDDTVRVTVAGNACVLLLGRERQYFPGFRTILVYPDTFVTTETTYDGYIETRGPSVRAGESWHGGPVVLAWGDILEDMRYPDDGRNVILHEFAHKLDEENETMDGLPALREPAHYAEWAEVLKREFDALQAQVQRGEEPVLDPYGAHSPEEFFSVVTEAFFHAPGMIREAYPELYEQFRRFYGVDPAVWSGG